MPEELLASPLACCATAFLMGFGGWLALRAAGWGRKQKPFEVIKTNRGVASLRVEGEHGNFDVVQFAFNDQTREWEPINYTPVDSSDSHKAHNGFWDRVEAGQAYLKQWSDTSVELGDVELLDGNGE